MTCPGKVKMWPKVVKSGLVRFKTSLFFCLLLLQGSISIKGQTSRGVATPTPRCSLGWWNRRCGRGLMNFDCIGPLKNKKCSWNHGDQSGALTISAFLHFRRCCFDISRQKHPPLSMWSCDLFEGKGKLCTGTRAWRVTGNFVFTAKSSSSCGAVLPKTKCAFTVFACVHAFVDAVY